MTAVAPSRPDAKVWILLPQVVSRLSALYVFAVAANRVSAEELGVLAVATAATAAAFGLVPAVVGRPLAVLPEGPVREERAPQAQSLATLSGLAAGALLGVGSAVTDGFLALTLLACAVGVPAAAVVESRYWRAVFLSGRRPAGLALAAAFLCQSAAVTAAALWAPPTAVVLSPFVGLALAAAGVLVAQRGGLSPAGARTWAGRYRPTWAPYVGGVLAVVALLQAVPTVLALVAGLEAASVYRAGELLFGGTNLLLAVAANVLLTQETADARRTYARAGGLLVAAAVGNGVVLAAVPERLVALLVGPVAGTVQDVWAVFTVQRAALALAYVGSVLVLRVLAPRTVGALAAAGAALNLALLLVGVLLGGVAGALVGLAVAESVVAGGYVLLVSRRVPR